MAIDLNFLCLLVDQNGWLSLFFSHLAFSSLSSLWSHPSHNSICWIMCSHIILSLFQRIFTALSHWHLIIQSWGEARRNRWTSPILPGNIISWFVLCSHVLPISLWSMFLLSCNCSFTKFYHCAFPSSGGTRSLWLAFCPQSFAKFLTYNIQ